MSTSNVLALLEARLALSHLQAVIDELEKATEIDSPMSSVGATTGSTPDWSEPTVLETPSYDFTSRRWTVSVCEDFAGTYYLHEHFGTVFRNASLIQLCTELADAGIPSNSASGW